VDDRRHCWRERGQVRASQELLLRLFRYDSSDTTGVQIVSVHQATGHTPGELPGDHPNDSGNGWNTDSDVIWTDLDGERHVDLGLSPDELPNTYYFFEDDTAGVYYIHIVIVRANGHHRHFGFGFIEKHGTWTGGEYAYGHLVHLSGIGVGYALNSAYHYCLLDGRYTGLSSFTRMYATMRLVSFPDEDPLSFWAEILAATEPDTATDSNGNPKFRVQGGYRAGPAMNSLGNFNVGRKNAFVNLIPIHLWAYYEQVSLADKTYYLGHTPDMRGVILDGIDAGEEVTVGTETWVCFPSVRKSESNYDSSLYQGIAYRKEVL